MSIENGIWLNEPKLWRCDNGMLECTTDAKTDFWRETHYSFVRDNGHFYGIEARGDFMAQMKVEGKYEGLYDQAGLMIRLDETRWLKAGIEFSDGQAMMSSVLTCGQSDWATAPYAHDPSSFWIRVTLQKGCLRLQASSDGQVWPLARLCPFLIAESCLVGPMCCTPERGGLRVQFSNFSLSPPLDKDLHDCS